MRGDEWVREGYGPCWVGWLNNWNMTGSWSEAERWYDARHEIAIKLGVSPLDVVMKWRNEDGTLTDSQPIKEEKSG